MKEEELVCSIAYFEDGVMDFYSTLFMGLIAKEENIAKVSQV